MTFDIRHQQMMKFVVLCALSLVGTYAYFSHGGTLVKAAWIYLGFMLVSRLHMVAHHKWLGHKEVSPGAIGRAVLLWSLVVCLLVKPVHYIIAHRMHHKYSDSDLDPHPNKKGFFNLLVGNLNIHPDARVKMKDVYRQKDVMFVNKYYYYLYLLNLAVFWFIDSDIVLLSFLLLNLKIAVNATIFNWVAHGGHGGTAPVNLPIWTKYVMGYWGEHNHKDHHDEINKLYNH